MYACPNLVNMSSSERKVSMRRPRSSGMTLRIFVRTSLFMEYRLSRGRSMNPDGIITGAVREFVHSRNPDRLLPRTPEPIGDTPRPAADAVQTGALRHGRAAAGEEPLSELGGGATVGPAHLAEQKSRQRPGPMSRDHRGGEIDQVRFAAGAGQDEPYRSEEHTSELQSPCNLVCRLLLEKKKKESADHRLTVSKPFPPPGCLLAVPPATAVPHALALS